MSKLIAFLLSLISVGGFSQCFNSDFEMGSFAGWQGYRGNCCPINTPLIGIVPGRHTIMSGPGTDPFTCNIVPVVCPWGGNFSARLGNSNVNSQAEALRYTFLVTPNSTLFTYSYAVVFEDPGHTIDEQPRFETGVIVGGNVIPCTQYMVTAASSLPGFQTCPGIDAQGQPIVRTFRNWSTVGVDLTPYLGQNVTVEFKTGDCDLGGHFGYAYLDAISCQPMQLVVNYCIGDSQAVLTAPPGFQHYTWSTGDTVRTIVVDPTIYNQVTCQLVSFSGCIANLSTTLQPADPQVSFSAAEVCVCDGISTVFANTSYATHSPIISWSWNFGDGFASSAQNPTHLYTQPGTYNVTLTAITQLGCDGTFTYPVVVHPCPVVPPISHN